MGGPMIDRAHPIVLINAKANLPVPTFNLAGISDFVSIASWKDGWLGTDAYIEVTASAACLIGDGGAGHGVTLWGARSNTPSGPAVPWDACIAIGFLGSMTLVAAATAPSIQIVAPPAGAPPPAFSSWGQIVHDVAIYDALCVGGLSATIVPAPAANITVTAFRIING